MLGKFPNKNFQNIYYVFHFSYHIFILIKNILILGLNPAFVFNFKIGIIKLSCIINFLFVLLNKSNQKTFKAKNLFINIFFPPKKNYKNIINRLIKKIFFIINSRIYLVIYYF